jgi:hypothetical protein
VQPAERSCRLQAGALPPVLILQLQRFRYDPGADGGARKVNGALRFGAALDVGPYSTVQLD